MLQLIKGRSYDVVRLYLNQIAIAFFGMALAFATGENQEGLRIGSSVFAILFYLFITYVTVWELGAKDSHKIERGEENFSRFTGLIMSLFASIPNIVLAILIMIGTLIPTTVAGTIGGIAKIAALLTEGMYTGLLAIKVGDIALNSLWYMYFLLPLPLIFTTSIAYFAGTKNFKLFDRH